LLRLAHLVEKSLRFSIPDARNLLRAKKLKKFEKMDFCAQLPTFLIENLTQINTDLFYRGER
jgi:hypothetical protein